MLLKEVNTFLDPSGYEIYGENPSGEFILCKRKGIQLARLTGLEKYMIETLLAQPNTKEAKQVLSLFTSVMEAGRI